jgi:hypothetical protein
MNRYEAVVLNPNPDPVFGAVVAPQVRGDRATGWSVINVQSIKI